MTNLEIYGQAKSDAKTSVDFKSDARNWMNEALGRVALVAKRPGEWHITVVSGTASYNFTNTAVAVPQFSPSVAPLWNGIKYAYLRKTGGSQDIEVEIAPENDRGSGSLAYYGRRTDPVIRIWDDDLIIDPSPTYGGTLKLSGYRSFQRWTGDDEDGDSPDIPTEFHYGLANYITAKYWLVKRQRDDMYQTWMDGFELMLVNLAGPGTRRHQGRSRIRPPRWL